MSPETSSPGDVVALLLDEVAPPRLGTMLRAARKQRSWTRRDVAYRVGTTASALRRYERGDEPVPVDLVAALAECYGDDLTRQLAARVPARVADGSLVVGAETRALEAVSAEEVLTNYVEIVGRLRGARPGEPLALRSADLVALSGALELDAEQVEQRIVEILGCTRSEARSLHAAVLRRRVVLPVAGLVAGLAVAGAGIGAAAGAPDATPPTRPVAAIVAVAPTAPTVTATAPAPTEPPVTAPAATAPAATVPAVTEPAATQPAAQPATKPPVITPDTTPMSIPAHETVTIIEPPPAQP